MNCKNGKLKQIKYEKSDHRRQKIDIKRKGWNREEKHRRRVSKIGI